MAQRKYQSYLELINAVDNVPLDFDFNSLYKLKLPNDPRPHGLMVSDVVHAMPWGDAPIAIDHAARTITVPLPSSPAHLSKNKSAAAGESLEITPEMVATTTATLQAVVDNIIAADAFGLTRGEHSEPYRIMGYLAHSQSQSPSSNSGKDGKEGSYATLERFPTPLFGIASRGAHMTCFVPDRSPENPNALRIWVARRAAHLFTYPGMLDTTVAGGVKAGDSPLECVVAEAGEEAGLDAAFVARHARAAGAVTYVTRSRRPQLGGAVSPTVLYVFDFELPAGEMEPVPTDGEVECFHLWSVEEVREAMLRGEFKPNCNLVMLDFFVRRGIMTPENEPDYVEIVTRLRRRLPVPTKP